MNLCTFLFAPSSDRIGVVAFIAHRAHGATPRPSEGRADMDWWRWKAPSLLPSLLPPPSIPPPPGSSPEWHPASCSLLSALYPRHCKYIHPAGAQRAPSPCNFRATCWWSDTNYLPLHVAALPLPLDCARSSWSGTPAAAASRSLSFFFFYRRLFISAVKAGEGMHVHPSFLYCLLRSDDFCLKWICCSRLSVRPKSGFHDRSGQDLSDIVERSTKHIWGITALPLSDVMQQKKTPLTLSHFKGRAGGSANFWRVYFHGNSYNRNISSFWRSAAYGYKSSPDFLNLIPENIPASSSHMARYLRRTSCDL